MRKTVAAVGAILVLGVIYLVAWPVAIEPVAWEAPINPGYTGDFAVNERLATIERFSIGDKTGPEAVAVGPDGRVYVSTKEGWIVRLRSDGSAAASWADTYGRPLGMEFDAAGNLIVADAIRGLLSIAPDGSVTTLATEADGIPIRYANEVDVAPDGRIYFSESSNKFAPVDWAGTYEAAVLDLMEHGGNGRLLVYDPEAASATTVLDGINYANGVAVAHDGSYVLVVETGSYRVIRIWLYGPLVGTVEPFIEELPGFPDNITRGMDGRYWIAFVSPRNAMVDRLSGKPFLRKMVQRLPAFLRPAAVAYGHVIAVNGNGRVVANLQDPSGGYPTITEARETESHLWLGSLTARELARIPLNIEHWTSDIGR
jgi:sugar lactone lactonase YvrE